MSGPELIDLQGRMLYLIPYMDCSIYASKDSDDIPIVCQQNNGNYNNIGDYKNAVGDRMSGSTGSNE